VLAQCPALAHLDLNLGHEIGPDAGERRGASWRGQASGLHL
jgi:hypothetical protein